ncbi:MAG TPA: aminoacyl-tRNA hydrolase [Candidatus Woesebacteria bacterium]|nr:aminoacyl-tRNA hydrolase [Candidatus Woesebacteria bacterium]
MYLIVGLGNPGVEYERSRHNAGFLFVEHLFKKMEFSLDKKFESEIWKIDDFILAKPQTFMNESGRAIRKIMDYFKLGISSLIVVHDDLDIAFGEYKIQKEKGPKVHNGLKSTEQYLGRSDFWRVRIGVDNRQPGVNYGTGADYVLSRFSNEEMKELDKVIEEAKKELIEILGLNNK